MQVAMAGLRLVPSCFPETVCRAAWPNPGKSRSALGHRPKALRRPAPYI